MKSKWMMIKLKSFESNCHVKVKIVVVKLLWNHFQERPIEGGCPMRLKRRENEPKSRTTHWLKNQKSPDSRAATHPRVGARKLIKTNAVCFTEAPQDGADHQTPDKITTNQPINYL